MTKKIAILIDGGRSHQMAQALNLFVDYRKLKTWVEDRFSGEVTTQKFYTQTPDGEHPIYKRIDFLEHNGWQVVERPAHMTTDAGGFERMVGDMDSYMVAEMVHMSHLRNVDHVVIFSGSADLVPGINALRNNYITVTGLGVHEKGIEGTAGRSFLMADFRRALSDNYVELSDVYDKVGSEKQERTDRPVIVATRRA